MCLLILSELVEVGILEHILIYQIILKKYNNLFGKIIAEPDSHHSILVSGYISFLGNCRHQLEEFEIENGRVYRFNDALSVEDKDALGVFGHVNQCYEQMVGFKAKDNMLVKRAADEVAMQVTTEKGQNYSLVSYMLDQGVYVKAYNQFVKEYKDVNDEAAVESLRVELTQNVVIQLLTLAHQAQCASILSEILTNELRSTAEPRQLRNIKLSDNNSEKTFSIDEIASECKENKLNYLR